MGVMASSDGPRTIRLRYAATSATRHLAFGFDLYAAGRQARHPIQGGGAIRPRPTLNWPGGRPGWLWAPTSVMPTSTPGTG